MPARRLLLIALLLCLPALLPAAASAHVGGAPQGDYQWGNAFAPAFSAAMKNVPESRFEKGPCTDEAARSMPADEGHDHLDVKQHRFKCRMEQVAFDSLQETFKGRPDLVLGEMDVKGNLAVVAIAYPQSGFLLYDIADAARPKLLSFYEGDECEGLIVDVDCGAFVDLSPDLKRVYISVQQISVVPGGASPGTQPSPAYPGVDVVSIANPKAPSLLRKVPFESVGGVHTTRSFDVPMGPESADEPREPGSYTVSVANGVGATISKADDALGLEPVGTIELEELHDTFIQQDPLTGRTLMYVAGGFDTGFYVYDVTAPSDPKLLAEWDLTPECETDWYSHTIDVTTRNGKRFVTMPVELIDFFGDQSDEDQGEGCGTLQGNGDMSGPLWIVDATNLGDLGPADPTGNDRNTAAENDELKTASEQSLTATWSNAANRAGGELTFSPHNQQIVGDKIYLSGYHSGVTVLDASAAFRDENVRPKEVAIHVPSAEPTRPIHPPRGGTTPVFAPFFTSLIDYRPLIWDMTFVNGHVLAADMVGGFYSLREVDEPAPRPAAPVPTPGQDANPTPTPITTGTGSGPNTAAPPCADATAPRSRFSGIRVTRRSVRVRGKSADQGCGGAVKRVRVAVGKRIDRKRCRFVKPNGRLSGVRRCSRPLYAAAKGTTSWSFARKAKLARGAYLVFVRAEDSAGNRERFRLRDNGRRTRVR